MHESTVEVLIEVPVNVAYEYCHHEKHLEGFGPITLAIDDAELSNLVKSELDSDSIEEELTNEILSSIAATNEEAYTANKGGEDR